MMEIESFVFSVILPKITLQQAKKEKKKKKNKAGCTANPIACGWAGVMLEKVIRASGQEPYAQ